MCMYRYIHIHICIYIDNTTEWEYTSVLVLSVSLCFQNAINFVSLQSTVSPRHPPSRDKNLDNTRE